MAAPGLFLTLTTLLIVASEAHGGAARAKSGGKKKSKEAAATNLAPLPVAMFLGPSEYAPARVNLLLPSPLRQTLPLNGEFEFREDPSAIGEKEEWFRENTPFPARIQVPGCLQAQGLRPDLAKEYRGAAKQGGQFGDQFGPSWHRKMFQIPWTDAGNLSWLKFGGVFPACKVWLNGKELGLHSSPFVPFKYNITDIARLGQNNTLVVEILESGPWRVLGGHYNKYGGLWSGIFRGVEIEQTPKTWIEDAFVRPDVKAGRVRIMATVETLDADREWAVEAEVTGATESERHRAMGSVKTQRGAGATVELTVEIANAKLWSPQHPYLYEARVTLKDGQAEVDSWRDRFGMREIRTENGQIYLNEIPLYIRGYGDIYVFPQTYSPSVDRDYYRRILQQAKDYGFNYVRHHSHIPVPECLDAADEVGVFVQEEAACIGNWAKESVNGFAIPDPVYEYVWSNVIRRDRNHPSVMTYCMGNEGYAQLERKEKLYQIAKQLDPTRFVIATAHHEGASLQWCDIVETNTDKYADKPYFRHEYGHWSSFPDVRLAGRYAASPGGSPFWVQEAEENAKAHGVADLLPAFAAESQELQRITRKYGIECFRLNKPLADGYTMWLGLDSMYTMGIWNDFGEPKNVSAEEFRMSNGETAILNSAPLEERVLWNGGPLEADLFVHHTGEQPISGGRLSWTLTGAGGAIASGAGDSVNLSCGAREKVAHVRASIPDSGRPGTMTLSAELTFEGRRVVNQWTFWSFPPPSQAWKGGEKPVLALIGNEPLRRQMAEKYPWIRNQGAAARGAIVVADQLNEQVLSHLEGGGRALLLAKGVFPEQVKQVPEERVAVKWATFLTGSNYYGGAGHTFGSLIRDSRLLGDFPQQGRCDVGFIDLLKDAPAMILDEWPARIEPAVRVIDYYGRCQSLACLFEVAVGEGSLLATSWTFDLDKPDSLCMFDQLLRYVASSSFQPQARAATNDLSFLLERAKSRRAKETKEQLPADMEAE